MSGVELPLGTLRLRGPDEFIAGGLRTNPNAWELILRHHPLAQEILGWIRHRVDTLHFSHSLARINGSISVRRPVYSPPVAVPGALHLEKWTP